MIMFELLSWIYTLMLLTDSEEVVFKYILVQRLVTLFIFNRLLFSLMPVLLLRLLVKMGIPPFHGWVLSVIPQIRKNSSWFFLTLHKLLPSIVLIIISFLSSKAFLIYLVAVILLVVTRNKLVKLILLSSISHTVWVLLGIIQNLYLGLKYWSLYSLLLLAVMGGVRIDFNLFSQFSLVLLISWLIWAGLPPFSVFWLKLLIVLSYLHKWIITVLVLLVLRVYTMWMYARILILQLWTKSSKPSFSFIFMRRGIILILL